MNIVKTITLNGKEILLTWDNNGYWIDEFGTVWPDIFDDTAYCGLEPFETGKYDPFWKKACKPHDKAFSAYKAGYQGTSNIKEFTKFSSSVLETMAQGAYAVIAGPFYIVVGGVGGMIRWLTLK